MQWEYKIVSSKIKVKGFVKTEPDTNNFEAILNELGRQNWELVSCNVPSSGGWGGAHVQAVLKRPK